MFADKRNIYIVSAALLFLSAVFSLGHHHFDEHFQILEFAGLKLGLTSIEQLPWEYEAQMRSTIQPLMVVLFYKCFALFVEPSPFFLAFFLRLLSAALFFNIFNIKLNILNRSNGSYISAFYFGL
jgi:GPI mannosyltransferase 3